MDLGDRMIRMPKACARLGEVQALGDPGPGRLHAVRIPDLLELLSRQDIGL